MIGFERLHDEPIADTLHLFALRDICVSRGDEENGNVEQVRIRAQLAAEIETVFLRHEQIGEHDIRPLAARKRERAGAVARFDDFVSGELEELAQDRPQDRFIVDQKDLLHASFCEDGS
jgi:hypothetical protein